MLIHYPRRRFVFKRFVFHYVAPMTRRIADADQNRLVFGFCLGKRLVAPRKPFDRIMSVLEEIG
jgi:hypothetical protein